jgi:hypothetical protein
VSFVVKLILVYFCFHGLRGERQAQSGGFKMAIEVAEIKVSLKNLSERLANIGGHL